MGKFDGKVVIVTGASAGIGESTAIAFAKEGANVMIVGRNAERLSAVAKECCDSGAKVLEVVCDLSDFASLESLIAKTVERFGAIDILVNNAADLFVSSVEQMQQEAYEKTMQVNVRAPIFLCKYALPHLHKTKGCIVNVSSISSMSPCPSYIAYSASKAALDNFTRGFASECAGSGVRVNSVNPGVVATKLLHSSLSSKAADNFVVECVKKQPLGILTGDEIAGSIMYLCEAKGVTGTNLLIDRGRLLQR